MTPWLVNGQMSELRWAIKGMRCPILNKNATGLGAPVAGKLNQSDWLNCCAETRPGNYGEQLPMLN